MFQISMDCSGKLVVDKVTRTDEELILFSARYLQIHDCFDSILETVCQLVVRGEDDPLIGDANEYLTTWWGWKDSIKVRRVIGIREKEGELSFDAIAANLIDFHTRAVHDEQAFESLKEEWHQQAIEEAYYHRADFLVKA